MMWIVEWIGCWRVQQSTDVVGERKLYHLGKWFLNISTEFSPDGKRIKEYILGSEVRA